MFKIDSDIITFSSFVRDTSAKMANTHLYEGLIVECDETNCTFKLASSISTGMIGLIFKCYETNCEILGIENCGSIIETDSFTLSTNFYKPGDELTSFAGLPSLRNRDTERKIGTVIDYDGHLLIYKFDSILENVSKSDIVKYGNGAACLNCKETYPYAEESNMPNGLFKCWACRNNW